ncbi:hypothetical protein ACIQZG_04450 [Lysinibacillus sp. NPDC096418]|uniref:hypothetical protein n=1 Tax=Lysinibacillus sp. NPDC096418 TaxID=3364138 RepID=UPI00382978A3
MLRSIKERKLKKVIFSVIGFGAVFAMFISWVVNKSILWAIIHGIFGWLYVIYYVIKK